MLLDSPNNLAKTIPKSPSSGFTP